MRRKNKSVLLNFIVTVFIGYCCYLIILYFLQRALIFPGRSLTEKQYKTDWINKDHVNWIDTPEGKIETWYFPAYKKSNPSKNAVVIFAHGNYELIDYCQMETEGLNKIGYDVFLIEYPGFGRSGGETTKESIDNVYKCAYDWLIANINIDPQKIVGFGRSLGGGAICDLAGQRSLAGVILQSTFANVKSFAKKYAAPEFLARDPFDNVGIMKNYKKPVLIFHGRHDELIPFWHGEQLAQNIPQAQFIAYDCEHNDCPPNWDEYWKIIGNFLDSTVNSKSK